MFFVNIVDNYTFAFILTAVENFALTDLLCQAFLPQEHFFCRFNPTGPTKLFGKFFDNFRKVGRTVKHLSATHGLSQEASGFDSRTLRHAEGTAEWSATGPENRGMVMNHGRSIRLSSVKLAQVREPG
jgi:hypothetical protein